jgi:hypothetical protein
LDQLVRIRAGGREIEFGLATTRQERRAVLAQRFRVFQRRGYYRPGLRDDQDAHDDRALYFLATLPDGAGSHFLLGSARLILGEACPAFRFPTEEAFEFELPPGIRETAVSERIEVGRVTAEAVQGIVIGGLLIPLGLLHAISAYVRPRGARAGLAVIKRRLLRAVRGAGVALYEIEPAVLVYPKDGPLSGYCYHSDPLVPVYWLSEEIGPSVERAIARHQTGDNTTPAGRDLPTPVTTDPTPAWGNAQRRLMADPDVDRTPRVRSTSRDSEDTDRLRSSESADEPQRTP